MMEKRSDFSKKKCDSLFSKYYFFLFFFDFEGAKTFIVNLE